MAIVTLQIFDAGVDLRARTVRGTERLGESSSFEIEAVSPEAIVPADVVDKTCALTIADGESFRSVRGTVVRFTAVAAGRAAVMRRFKIHLRSGGFLLEHLSDEDLAEHAADALETMFGPIADEEQREHAAAWERAIGALGASPDLRYRQGVPWRPKVVADECRSGRLSRGEVELRLVELAVRTGRGTPLDLSGWSLDVEPALTRHLAGLERVDSSASAGTWDVVLRHDIGARPIHAQPRPGGAGATSAPLQGLTVEQYASLCAELAVFSDRTEQVFARHGLVAAADRIRVNAAWQDRLGRDPAVKAYWERCYRHYQTYWAGAAPASRPRR